MHNLSAFLHIRYRMLILENRLQQSDCCPEKENVHLHILSMIIVARFLALDY